MKLKILIAAFGLLVILGVLALPVGGEAVSFTKEKASPMDLSAFPATKPSQSQRLLFIHHSVGGQWLADEGPDQESAPSIHPTHENGGGLRKALRSEGYEVNEASYGSAIGEDTDIFHWLPKFRDSMDKVLRVEFNDKLMAGEQKNRIVMFKSCYPNTRFESLGEAPGDPKGPLLTVWNAKATLTSLLEEFKKHPDTLFIYVTAPPNAPKTGAEPIGKVLLKKILGKPSTADILAQQASLARIFDSWVVSKDGWLENYPLKNVVVFDLFDVLTDHGESNFLRYPTGRGDDSHPSKQGHEKATAEFVPFLNRAVHRFELAH